MSHSYAQNISTSCSAKDREGSWPEILPRLWAYTAAV